MMDIPGPESNWFFLDSGAHTLYNQHVWTKPEVMRRPLHKRYSYYETPAFWKYVDEYAAFVKKHRKYIDYYANVDVIYEPAMSWRVLKYLEDTHKLTPVPVIHFGADMKWVRKHMNAGYEFLGVGGLGQGATKNSYRQWANGLFSLICPPPKYLPVVRTHGFAMTAFDLITHFPWWSVDSATWTKVGAFGSIFVPRFVKGKYVFDVEPYMVAVSDTSPSAQQQGKHFNSCSLSARNRVKKWLEIIEVPLGKNNPDGTVAEYGVINRHSERKIANLLFFERLRKSLPDYPWPFNSRAGLENGVAGQSPRRALFVAKGPQAFQVKDA